MEERRIVERFDKDGDRRLNRIERKAARDWLANQPRGGRSGGPNPPAGAMPPPPFGGREFRARFSWPADQAGGRRVRQGRRDSTIRRRSARSFCNSKTRSGSGSSRISTTPT